MRTLDILLQDMRSSSYEDARCIASAYEELVSDKGALSAKQELLAAEFQVE